MDASYAPDGAKEEGKLVRSLTNRVRRAATALVAVLAAGALLAPVASAEVGDKAPADMPEVNCNGFTPDQLNGALLVFCIELQLLEGKAKFGSIESPISQPVTLRQVMGLGPGLSVVSIDEGDGEGSGGSGLPPVKVPGGLLGALGLYQGILQPIIDALEPINGVTGDIQTVGEMALSSPDVLAFIAGEGLLTTAELPIKVQIKNLLLGETCYIGNDENPVQFNLPVTLTGGYHAAGGEPGPNPLVPGKTAWARLDVTDDVFDIPAARDCGLLGVGQALNQAGLDQLNVFDTTINNSVGLPSPSGNNVLDFDGFMGVRACNPTFPADNPDSCLYQPEG